MEKKCLVCGKTFYCVPSQADARKHCSWACAKITGKEWPILDRFWKRVQKGGPDECWLWTGHKDVGGYGYITIRRSPIRAHIFSYKLAYGPVPEGLCVLHACDNPSCVNPAHLWTGTNRDNTNDAMRKGRFNGINAKLTEDQVREIRKSTEPTRSICQRYGVTHGQITKVRRRTSWKYVTD